VPVDADPIPSTATRAAFPLGGIGTGNVSLGARGELRDWELENHPDKGRDNPYSFFAIHVRPAQGDPVTRVLEARRSGPLDHPEGFGTPRLAGLPRLDSATLRGEYPFAEIDFQDAVLPVQVRLTAFTPLIPLDPDESGIPGAILRYTVTNPSDAAVTVTVTGSVSHVAAQSRGYGPWPSYDALQSVEWRDADGIRGLAFDVDLPRDDLGYGTLALATTDQSTTAKPCWSVNFWSDGPQLFWDDLTADGLLDAEPGLSREPVPTHRFGDPIATQEQLIQALPKLRTGSLGIVHDLAPGETRDFEFVLAWSFPNRPDSWQGHVYSQHDVPTRVVRNAYALRWPDAWSAAAHLVGELPRLEAASRAFNTAVRDTTLDPAVVDAITANIATLRSTTCFRIEDPRSPDGTTFLAWEGSFEHEGSCEGTCTHVWSYAQTVAWLFPSLERSARRVEFLLETEADGLQRFRTNRVWGREPWAMGPAVDGQLGTIIRLHREWRFSGDDAFLAELWPAAVRSLDYAIREWSDGDLLGGELHNTYDIEFVGIDPLANTMFLAALAAMSRMARALDEDATRYEDALARAAEAADRILFNGEYYRQVVDDVDAHRFQYGDGVLSDQLLGQFHAHVNGFGYLLPADHVRSAAEAIFAHNFRADLANHESTQRAYALDHEGGLLLATWPNGGRPVIPFIYSDEVWTGIEYQVAAELVYDAHPEQALAIVRAARARHDGARRSPWNEIECGNHYARSLASWALLLAFSGVQYDGAARTLSFDPAEHDYAGFFSTGTGWGHVATDANGLTLRLDHGTLDARVALRGTDLGPANLTAGKTLRLERT
jgi:uncharacterized protein (DUF608 family)